MVEKLSQGNQIDLFVIIIKKIIEFSELDQMINKERELVETIARDLAQPYQANLLDELKNSGSDRMPSFSRSFFNYIKNLIIIMLIFLENYNSNSLSTGNNSLNGMTSAQISAMPALGSISGVPDFRVPPPMPHQFSNPPPNFGGLPRTFQLNQPPPVIPTTTAALVSAPTGVSSQASVSKNITATVVETSSSTFVLNIPMTFTSPPPSIMLNSSSHIPVKLYVKQMLCV